MATLFDTPLPPDILRWLASGKKGPAPFAPTGNMATTQPVAATQPPAQPQTVPPTQYGFGPEQNFFPNNAIPAAWFETPYGPETMTTGSSDSGSSDSSGVFGGDAATNLLSAAAGAAGGYFLDGEGAGIGGGLGGLLAGPGGALTGAKLGAEFLNKETLDKVKDFFGLGPTLQGADDRLMDAAGGTGELISASGGIDQLAGAGSGADRLGGPTNLPPSGAPEGLFSDANLATAGDVLGVGAGLFNIYNAIQDPNAGSISSAALSIPSTLQSGANLAGIGGASVFPATLGGSALAASAAAAAPALIFAGFNQMVAANSRQSRAGNTVMDWSPDKGWVFKDWALEGNAPEGARYQLWDDSQQAAHMANELARVYGLETDHDAWQQASSAKPYSIYGIGTSDKRNVPANMPTDARGWLSNVFTSGMYRSSDPAVQQALDTLKASPGATPEQILTVLESARPGAGAGMAPFDQSKATGPNGWTGALPTRNEEAVNAGFAPPQGGELTDFFFVGPTPDNPTGWQRLPAPYDPALAWMNGSM